MHRRIEDQNAPGPRRVPGEQLSRVIAQSAAGRYDNADNPISGALQFAGALGSYQHPQMVQGQLPQQQPVHAPVAAPALASVHQGGVANLPNAHAATPHQGNSGPTPQLAQMGQVPPGGLGGPPSGHQQQQQFQRLKVEDALSYLDQVKLQFGNQPSVYNDFLDIMKEFKSQTIDTPGVINRVSNLFKGHPDLIVGFNTFLPPGYKIEVERDVISVLQPGQGSMPISALNAAANAAASANAIPQLQTQRSPAHGLPGANNNAPSGGAHSVAVAAAAANQPSSQAPPVHPYSTSNRPPGMHSDLPPGALHGGAAGGGGSGASGGAGAQGVVGMAGTSPQGSSTQPVEFNHAINYVNKIKNRFQGQPEVYKQFLEILHTYQKEQRTIKEQGLQSSNKPLTETEVYSQVAHLFSDQEDLLAEFGQFLPDANGGGSNLFFPADPSADGRRPTSDMALGVRNDHSSTHKKPTGFPSKSAPMGKTTGQLKRPSCTNTSSSSSAAVQPPAKKYKSGILKDVSLAEAGKFASLKEYAFFDSVRNALRSNDVYNNFLRCLILFNSEIISRSELITMVHPFLAKHCELYRWFKDFLGHKDSTSSMTEAVPQVANKERSVRDDYNMEIDYQSCKRYGASYRALPSTYPQPKCSGRSQLCREVLNDTWVSIPTWSEDSTFVTSRKSAFEEHIYRCEDERFELDVVLETNFAAIKTLETVSRKIQRMSPEEATKFRLDNSLGGTSEFVTRKAICRLYGEKATDIIDGLKKNPVVAVPLVLRRLKAKDEEWRDAQKGFNKLWREQNEKYYLKSLDHQGMTFKQNDVKALRGKSMVNEIEAILEETQEANQQGQNVENAEPHIREKYEDKTVFEDAASVVIHHMKRSSSIHHEEKKKIKQLVYHQIRDFLFYPRGELSDDEDENDEDGDNSGSDKKPKEVGDGGEGLRRSIKQEVKDGWTKENGLDPPSSSSRDKLAQDWPAPEAMDTDQDDTDDDQYILFFGNTNWYLFNRLHHKLCQRLVHFRRLSNSIAQQEESSKTDRKASTAMALRLRTPFEVEPSHYYSFFLESIKNLLDCSIESSQYEDNLREMYGINSYTAFTMDKHVQQIVRVLHHLVTEELSVEMIDLFNDEALNNATGGTLSTRHQRAQAELTYQRKAEALVSDDNCYKFVFYKRSGQVQVTLMDQGGEQTEDVGDTERWAQYVERFIGMSPTEDTSAPSVSNGSGNKDDSSIQQSVYHQLLGKPVFLSRNVTSWRRNNLMKGRGTTEEDEEDMDEDTKGGEEAGSGGEEDKKEEGGSRGRQQAEEENEEERETRETLEAMRAAQAAHAMEYVNDVNNGQTMIGDGAGVRFTVNSLKMHHICWGQEIWYRVGAIYSARRTHKKFSLAKHHKFDAWLSKWKKAHVTEDEELACQDWLTGHVESIPPASSTTHIRMIEAVDKAPYYTYRRYIVKRHTPVPSPIPPPVAPQQTTPPAPSVVVPPAVMAPSAPVTLTSAPPTSDLVAAAVARTASSRPLSRPSTPAE